MICFANANYKPHEKKIISLSPWIISCCLSTSTHTVGQSRHTRQIHASIQMALHPIFLHVVGDFGCCKQELEVILLTPVFGAYP
jgi:hypothetical protein